MHPREWFEWLASSSVSISTYVVIVAVASVLVVVSGLFFFIRGLVRLVK